MLRLIPVLTSLFMLGHHSKACGPFLGIQQGPTLRQEYAGAEMVFVGSWVKARWTNENAGEGVTTIAIGKVLKVHPLLKDKKLVDYRRYLRIQDPEAPPKYLVFADVYKNELDMHKGLGIQSESAIVDYLQEAVALDPKDREKVVRFFFQHLEHDCPTIANDSLAEFAAADYRDVKPVAPKLPADQLARWLQKPDLAAPRVRLYGTLLGDCGDESHAKLLRKKIDAATSEGLEGLLVGYFLLKPKEGADVIRSILEDEKALFVRRFNALQAVRFLGTFRQDRLDRKTWMALTAVALKYPDMTDFAVFDFRRGKHWEMSEAVLDVYGKKDFEAPIIRREIALFALQSPQPRAKALIIHLRQTDPELMETAEYCLREETSAVPPRQAPPIIYK